MKNDTIQKILFFLIFLFIIVILDIFAFYHFILNKRQPTIPKEEIINPTDSIQEEVTDNEIIKIIEESGQNIEDVFQSKKLEDAYGNLPYYSYFNDDFTEFYIIHVSSHSVSFIDKNHRVHSTHFQKEKTKFQIGETIYTLHIKTDFLTLIKNEEKTFQLHPENSKNVQIHPGILLYYENTLHKMNRNEIVSDEDTWEALSFATYYFYDSSKMIILPAVGLQIAISKEEVLEFLRQYFCKRNYQIHNFDFRPKLGIDYYDYVKANNNNFTMSREEFANLYSMHLSPSGIDGSGGFYFDYSIATEDDITVYTFYKVVLRYFNGEQNYLETLKLRVNQKQKCLDY